MSTKQLIKRLKTATYLWEPCRMSAVSSFYADPTTRQATGMHIFFIGLIQTGPIIYPDLRLQVQVVIVQIKPNKSTKCQ